MKAERLYHYARVLILTLLMTGCTHAFKTGTVGKCIGVKDGDTIVVLIDNTPVTIRLAEIDCPEKRQAFGQKAKQFTSDLCFGKEVSVVAKNKDRYGRTVGIVYIDDNTVLNKELVKAGFAWRYVQYCDEPEYEKLENEARAAGKGLWADAHPEAPWEYRKESKSNPLHPSHKKKRQAEPEPVEEEVEMES